MAQMTYCISLYLLLHCTFSDRLSEAVQIKRSILLNNEDYYPLMPSLNDQSDHPLKKDYIKWNPADFESQSSSPSKTERKRLKKLERRKEKQERRQERRRNRQRSSSKSSSRNSFGTDYVENEFDSFNQHGQESIDLQNPPFAIPESRVGISDWLKVNISSIWETLNYIQREIKQLRKQHRGNNPNRGSSRRTGSHNNIVTTTTEPCVPEWSVSPNSCIDENGQVCNRRGKCVCGQCVCDTPFYGMHCVCNDMECDKYGGMLCGGAGRGQCRCGSCICREGYTGSACECPVSVSECKKFDGEICSGQGKCVCNHCQCNEGYAGKYCDESIYSASICERLKPCVLCLAYGKKYPKCEECDINVEMVDELESSRATCFMINQGCILKYTHVTPTEEGGRMTVLVQKKRSCL